MTDTVFTNKQTNELLSQDTLILNSVLNNHEPLTKLIIIQDCSSQAGLPILFQLIDQLQVNSSEVQQQDVLLIKTSSDLLLDQFQKIQSRLKVVNSRSSFQFIDLAQLLQHDHQEKSNPAHENRQFDSNDLLQLVRQAISDMVTDTTLHKSGKPLTILVDTIQELFRLFSIHQTFNLIKNLLNLLPNSESRLVILDSPHLNLKMSHDPLEEISEPSVGLKSLAISTSYLHLRIHPTSLIDHLINDFGLTVPIQSKKQSGTHYDLRLFQLIHELAPNCDPYLIKNSTTTNKNQLATIPQALLIPPSSSKLESKNLGSCVIEWTAKNLQSCFSSRASTSIKSNSKKSQKGKPCSNHLSSVQHGLEALQLSLDPLSSIGFQLTPMPVSSVIKKRLFKLSMGDHTQSDSVLDPIQNQLTFNLSLTEKQRADRDAVELPFLPKRSEDGTVIKAPGEMYDGSFQKTDSRYPNNRSGGMILYEPDSADDFDDEEPDDD